MLYSLSSARLFKCVVLCTYTLLVVNSDLGSTLLSFREKMACVHGFGDRQRDTRTDGRRHP